MRLYQTQIHSTRTLYPNLVNDKNGILATPENSKRLEGDFLRRNRTSTFAEDVQNEFSKACIIVLEVGH